MASLDKLAIRGVRSFNDRDVNIIQFFTPLTVIVGYNGSGKTTIIECLKYATTGDMPPNSKGGAFVHDPKMSHTSEVKAQVRLRFYSTDKRKINCVRNVQVTQKKGSDKLTMKTLESVLSVDDEKANKRGTVSTKCADLDEEMPRLLGVSKAVLDSVIFCHQEDSNWPLSEASVLKKKFDDIFDATRYTKALDNIKKIRKDRAQELKVRQAELEGLKKQRDQSETLKKRIAGISDRIEERNAELEELNEQIRIVTKENKQFYDMAVKFRELVAETENLEDHKKLYDEQRARLQHSMTHIDEDEQELQRRKDSFQDHLGKQQRKKDDLSSKIDDKRREFDEVEGRKAQKLSEKGALESDKKHHEDAMVRREKEIRQLSLELGVRGFDVEGLSDRQIEDFSTRVAGALQKAEDDLRSFKAKSSKKETVLANEYQDLRTERSAKLSTRETTATSNRRQKERIKRLQDDMDGMLTVEADLLEARQALKEEADKAERYRRELEEANFDEQIRKKNSDIRDLDERREELTSRLNELNRHAHFRAKLDVKKKDAEQKTKAIQNIMERNAKSFKQLTGDDPTAANFEREINRAGIVKDQAVVSAEREQADKHRSLQHIESVLSISRSSLRQKREQVIALTSEVKSYLEREGNSNFDNIAKVADDAEQQIEAVNADLATDIEIGRFYVQLLEHSKSHHTCLGCNRSIKENETSGFEEYVKAKIAQASDQKRSETESDLQWWKGVLSEARALMPKEHTLKELQGIEIPELQQTIDQQVEELTKKAQSAEQASDAVKAAKEEQSEINSLRKAATEIARLGSEVATLSSEVASLETDLTSTGSAQTGDEVQGSITELADTIKKAKRELQAIERNREAKRNDVSNAERAVIRSERILAEKEKQDHERTALQKQIHDLSSEYNETSAQLKALDGAIDGLDGPIKRAQQELDLLQSGNAQEESDLMAKVESLRTKSRGLRECEEAINRYVTQRGAQKLTDCNDQIDLLQSQMMGIRDEIKAIEGRSSVIEKDLNQAKATERNLDDNLQYRQLGRQLSEIEDKLNSIDLEQASKSRAEFESKYHAQKETENVLNGQASNLAGQIKGLEDEHAAREDELDSEYKDIHVHFSRKLVEVKTSEIANSDLEKYAKALDAAIIHFHGLKMTEINQQLDFLWKKTYQGNDIDSISIESDSETVGNRTYNYRVCMQKDSVKMDMRGRCSAGQKVLASIIIRLALADSFATNCRFMALDEPTLCLDQETVEALAQSLGDIIKERPHTQLLVVTHDPHFLTLLAQSTDIEYYWRVSRGTDMKSVIEKERIRG